MLPVVAGGPGVADLMAELYDCPVDALDPAPTVLLQQPSSPTHPRFLTLVFHVTAYIYYVT